MRYVLIAVLLLAGCDTWNTDAVLIVSNQAGGITVLRFDTSQGCIDAYVAMPAAIARRVDAWCVFRVKR